MAGKCRRNQGHAFRNMLSLFPYIITTIIVVAAICLTYSKLIVGGATALLFGSIVKYLFETRKK